MIQCFTEFRCTCGVSFEDGQAQKAVDHVLSEHMRPKDKRSKELIRSRVRVMIYPNPFVEGGSIPENV
jgi:hypothetical protein